MDRGIHVTGDHDPHDVRDAHQQSQETQPDRRGVAETPYPTDEQDIPEDRGSPTTTRCPSNISCQEVRRIRLDALTGSMTAVARLSTAAKGDSQATYWVEKKGLATIRAAVNAPISRHDPVHSNGLAQSPPGRSTAIKPPKATFTASSHHGPSM